MANGGFEDRIEDYYKALGEFIHTFSQVEAWLQTVLWHEAGTPGHIAKAVFSGVKSDTARSFISRVIEAKGREIDSSLKYALDHIGVLTTMRNDIVHYGADFFGPKITVTNRRMAHVPERARQNLANVATLKDMTGDLLRATRMLGLYCTSTATTSVAQEARLELQGQASIAWRYRPPPQPSQTKTRSKPHPKRRATSPNASQG